MKWVILALVLVVAWAGCRVAEGNHNVYLPYAGETQLAKQISANQAYTYCLDSRAAAYPNFLSQLQDVNAQYTQRVGIRSTQVAYGDVSCMVKHEMPTNITCDGWAARIYYANWPVKVEYCYTLGYTDWRTAHGHELGHGLLGLHEQYRDSGGSIACTGQQWTVMDCSSGIRYPQVWDVEAGCAVIKTAWCGRPATAEPVCEPYGGCWLGTYWEWKIDSAVWTYDPANHTGPSFDTYGGWYCHTSCPNR